MEEEEQLGAHEEEPTIMKEIKENIGNSKQNKGARINKTVMLKEKIPQDWMETILCRTYKTDNCRDSARYSLQKLHIKNKLMTSMNEILEKYK